MCVKQAALAHALCMNLFMYSCCLCCFTLTAGVTLSAPSSAPSECLRWLLVLSQHTQTPRGEGEQSAGKVKPPQVLTDCPRQSSFINIITPAFTAVLCSA